MPHTRAHALTAVTQYFEDGRFAADLAKLVAHPTESQRPGTGPALLAYLTDGLGPRLTRLGFAQQVFDNPVAGGGPILVARRVEAPALPHVLIYGHGDVVYGEPERWSPGLEPFTLTETEDRFYGRGVADNKGQHLINIAALEAVLATRGRLGFNVTLLIEMSEETGSTGLEKFCAANRDMLAADVLIASDGPRVVPEVPTVFLGARGVLNFELRVDLREDARHSGNWGGLLRDPGVILSQAIATITDARGQLRVPEWRPDSLTEAIRADLAALAPEGAEDWNEAALSPAERLYGWNSFSVLALEAGNPAEPQNAIPGAARALCQLRFVVGTAEDDILPALRRHLLARGFEDVEVRALETAGPATRQNRDTPWVRRVETALAETSGQAPHVLPNLAGWIPNHCFSDILGLPAVWIPHSYAGCRQHAPYEHVLKSLCRDALRGMVGVFWEVGEG